MAVADPFMAGVPTRRPGDFERTAKGVPLVAHPTEMIKDGSRPKKVMYRRPSSFGKQIENTYNLQKWGERQEALGFALDPDLIAKAQELLEGDRESKEWKDRADDVVMAAKAAAKAWIAAERGTHTHGLAEDDDNDLDIVARIEHGEALGLPPDVQQALVDEWRSMLERNGLEIVAVEFAVINDHYRAAGTGDRVAKLTKSLRFRLLTGELIELPGGTHVILDIKTGQRRLDPKGVVMYWQSYAVQVALYAPPGAQLYDPDTDTRTPFPWPVNEDWALIAHLDVLGAIAGAPACELVLVDLRAGRRAADLCVAAREWESDNTVFSAQIVPVEVEPQPATAARNSTGATPQLAPDPERLRVVDARDTLCVAPEQGADLSVGFDELWGRLRALFDGLDPAARSWRGELVGQATRAGVPFHAQGAMTERTYNLNRAVITLALLGATDEILRALLALIVGDVALFPAIRPGHVLGSLSKTEAERFAGLCDAYAADRLQSYTDDEGSLRYRDPDAA